MLIHDLGMGLAAYPAGLADLRKQAYYQDSVALRLRDELGRPPTGEDIAAVSEAIQREATADALRFLHAQRAADLALVPWVTADNRRTTHLIEDEELRTQFGALVGTIAQSHHWDVEDLSSKLGPARGAPAAFPPDWTLDPVKVACILRVADAAHLDSRRAPAVLRAVRRPAGTSSDHWLFQESLMRPTADADGALRFTSARPFPVEQADAWFLCMDAIEMVDKELRAVDQLLQQTGRARFRANRVNGARDYAAISECIPTAGWIPVDTRLRVSDVSALVSKLGGEALYGHHREAGLRELIQNGVDAIRARRLFERRPAEWGEITVRLGKDQTGHWLEVQDTGIGMSSRVLTGPLLDFGKSYWASPLFREESPGLIAAGFDPVGKYGIGFFAVFMLGANVRVTSRRCDAAHSDTMVLEFRNAAFARPVLRPASSSEQLVDGGTVVRVWLPEDPVVQAGFFGDMAVPDWSMETALGRLCPALDVNLTCDVDGHAAQIVVANDWRTIAPEELVRRVWGVKDISAAFANDVQKQACLDSLNNIYDGAGNQIGRLGVFQPVRGSWRFRQNLEGCVSVGGLRSSGLNGLQGILVGQAARAARDVAVPIVAAQTLSDWATSQARSVSASATGVGEDGLAAIAWGFGGDPIDQPVGWTAQGYVSRSQLIDWAKMRSKVLLVGDLQVWYLRQGQVEVEWDQDLLIADSTFVGHMTLSGWGGVWPPYPDRDNLLPFAARGTLFGAAFRFIAEAWSLGIEDLLSVATIYESDDPSEPLLEEIPPIGRIRGADFKVQELWVLNRP